MNKDKEFEQIFLDNRDTEDQKYSRLGLKFNPFPRSGTTNINGSDLYNQKLVPVNDKVKTQIYDFVTHALNPNAINDKDKFISATITGNYGSGKTQLLMFVKYILGQVSISHLGQKNPYCIYIDNPGVNLLEFIGSIIKKIGEDDFKKYIWTKIIKIIKESTEIRAQLKRYQHQGIALFDVDNADPFSLENSVSYKKFLDTFVRQLISPKQRKDFDASFKQIITSVLAIELNDTVLSQYFYDLVSDDYGVNKTWEALSSGTIKQLDRKEADIIRYIVRLIKEQGYTDFFILVDEFEDITEGRLTKMQIDNYVYNLRTLLDEHREWCLFFAMTGQALKKLRSVSPPLADRITTRLINLQDLNKAETKKIVINYLAIAKSDEIGSLLPFDDSGIDKLNQLTEGNARKLLKNCFYMVEKAAEQGDSNIIINSEFISVNYSQEFI